jgi:hypothetical protein
MRQSSARKSAVSEETFHISSKPDFELNEQELDFYNVLIGNYKYIATPWTEEDL